jgi:hypothetical protein
LAVVAIKESAFLMNATRTIGAVAIGVELRLVTFHSVDDSGA